MVPDIVRVGVVSAIEGTHARVVFPDRDELVSAPFPVLQHGAKRTQGHWMPEVGEQVVCCLLPFGIEQGFILGSYYSEAQPAPSVATGAVVVAGDSVHLGDYDADDPVVRKSDLQQAVDDVRGLINDVKTSFDAHTHPVTGAVPAAPPAPPLAGPPLVPMPPPAPVTAEGSEKVFSS